MGVAGMAESGAPLRAGRPVGPIIAWHDGRGEETVASLERRFGPDLPRWTGRRVRTVSSVAKLGWLVDHGLPTPDRWLGVPELAPVPPDRRRGDRALPGCPDRRLPRHRAPLPAGGDRHRPRRCRGRRPSFRPFGPPGPPMGFISEDGLGGFGLPAGIPVTDRRARSPGRRRRTRRRARTTCSTRSARPRPWSAGSTPRPTSSGRLELDLAVTLWPGGDAWGVLASAARSGLVIDALAAHLGMDPSSIARAAALGHSPGRAETTGAAGATGGSGPGDRDAGGPAGAMWLATLQALSPRTAAAAETGRRPGRAAPPAGGLRRRQPQPASGDRPRPPKSASRCCVLRSSMPRSGGPRSAPGSPQAGGQLRPTAHPQCVLTTTGRAEGPVRGPDHDRSWREPARAPVGGDNGAVMTDATPEGPIEPEMSPEVAERTSGLRTGWTTGTCASAAAKAAAIGLCTGTGPRPSRSGLPDGGGSPSRWRPARPASRSKRSSSRTPATTRTAPTGRA